MRLCTGKSIALEQLLERQMKLHRRYAGKIQEYAQACNQSVGNIEFTDYKITTEESCFRLKEIERKILYLKEEIKKLKEREAEGYKTMAFRAR